ncbi:tetratricopeptide repeat protein [Terasakiella sp. A23]|uniref:tetratricopeptide repeat protein n=1 Tax=Terasakiella sp. FCG-A23 TaxID=3080561 RepID=UPI002954941D|nr:tetratricopeptide repeat protein [Terasakiella sp. A23]MDV7341720.1 tetratricopeptide repeat protein [Terasakiella sp. A23]
MKPLLVLICLLLPIFAHAQTAVDGYQAYETGDYAKAREIILPLVDKGDPVAMNALGNWHADGIIVEKSRKIACDLYEKAAHKNYAPAQNNFSFCFDTSGGRKRSTKLHLEWMTKAAEQSYVYAQIYLLKWYLDTNKEKARYWGEQAAAQNSATARTILWLSNLDQNIPPVSITEIACVITKISILKQGWQSCDG